MKKKIVCCLLVSVMMVSGCLSEKIEDTKDSIASEEVDYTWEDDRELIIVTYDVTGLTDSMITTFENQTGYDVKLVKLDDAGSILDHLMQYKGVQIADLALGLDNTYLQTALDNDVLWKHSYEN